MLADVEVSISVSEVMPECVQRHASYPLLTRPGFGHASCQREQPYFAYAIKYSTGISATEVSTAIREACQGRIAIPQMMERICHCFDSEDPHDNHASRRLQFSISAPSCLATPKIWGRQRFIAAGLAS